MSFYLGEELLVRSPCVQHLVDSRRVLLLALRKHGLVLGCSLVLAVFVLQILDEIVGKTGLGIGIPHVDVGQVVASLELLHLLLLLLWLLLDERHVPRDLRRWNRGCLGCR